MGARDLVRNLRNNHCTLRNMKDEPEQNETERLPETVGPGEREHSAGVALQRAGC